MAKVFVLAIGDERFEIDEDGFLINYSDYCDSWVKRVLREEDVDEMTNDHWTLIKTFQDYYEKNGKAPMVRTLSKLTKFRLMAIYELFPSGPGMGVCRAGGLPKPVGCVSGSGAKYKKLALTGGEVVDVDRDGFLINPDQFSRAWLKHAQVQLGIQHLKSDHKVLIQAAQAGFKDFGYLEFLPKLKETANIGAIGIQRLFPGENELGVCFLAGLPKPLELGWSLWERGVETVVLNDGSILALDKDGFPLEHVKSVDLWHKFVMEREEIEAWTPEHDALDSEAYRYHFLHGDFPPDRVLARLTKFKMKHVFELFPVAGEKSAFRATGIPQKNF